MGLYIRVPFYTVHTTHIVLGAMSFRSPTIWSDKPEGRKHNDHHNHLTPSDSHGTNLSRSSLNIWSLSANRFSHDFSSMQGPSISQAEQSIDLIECLPKHFQSILNGTLFIVGITAPPVPVSPLILAQHPVMGYL